MRDAAPTKGVDHEPAGATTVRFCLPIAEQKPAAIVQGQSPFVRGGNADAEELRRRNAREGQPHRLHRGW